MVLAEPTLELTDKLLKDVTRQYGEEAKSRLLEWKKLMDSNPGTNEIDTLATVNAFFNRIPQKDDSAHWGQENYWATPIELLVTKGGDCEDFAIAKYFTLRRLGIADDKLRISYVKAFIPEQGKIQAHMVLSYYPLPSAEPLILDNLNPAILPASQRRDLMPIYGFNGAGLWRAKERGRTSNDLGLWRELLTRMQHELDGDTLGAHLP
ncbi:transglutaminase-like cysteine peptidase [Methylococcus sp. EFPC2]|nr:transglutaminase-like cysteine peptidase [Methylococcus sp. EFPC2]